MKNNFISKIKIPKNLHGEIKKAVDEIKKMPNQEKCLQKAYEIMTNRYRGYKFRTYSRLFQIFTFDAQKLWSKTGFIHCHNANYLMRILLVKSGFFKNADIKNKWTLVYYISPHQYLLVKLDNGQYVNIDIWGKVYGIKFGDYARGFH
ncbi:hypothetical protein KAS41_01450 [Candidatus Parcubacteria bacterium]|nr:hypothetical protein [Candidatus Parcubacteria bacterium]